MKKSPMNEEQFDCGLSVLLASAYMGARRGRAGTGGSLHGIFRTANENEMRLSAAICTANIAGVADGGWALISPYGDHAAPDGSYAQRFDRQQAGEVVKTWNSITGQAARVFKNMWHGLGAKFTAPVWDGHPETDRQRWPKEKLLAEITDLRAGEAGLEGCITWNARGASERSARRLYPSALWWHLPPSGIPPLVFPELLESVGLVATPNISGVPAWTANANPFAGDPQAENQNQNDTMNQEQLDALRKALNLPVTADAATIISTANAALQLTTANSTLATEKADVETKLREKHAELTTANEAKTAALQSVTDLSTANTALTTEVAALRKGALDLAEKKGALTPAERPAFDERLKTANTRDAAFTELQTRKALDVDRVEIHGSRVDITTANARADVINTAVAKRMKDTDCDYDAAYVAVQKDPMFAAVFAAMADPARAAGK